MIRERFVRPKDRHLSSLASGAPNPSAAMNSLRQLFHRLLHPAETEIDWEVDRILRKAFWTPHPYPPDVVNLCREFEWRARPHFEPFDVAEVNLHLCDRGDYRLELVFRLEAGIQQAISSGVIPRVVAEAVEFFTAHGQNLGFEVAHSVHCCADINLGADDYEIYMNGRFKVWRNPGTGQPYPEDDDSELPSPSKAWEKASPDECVWVLGAAEFRSRGASVVPGRPTTD